MAPRPKPDYEVDPETGCWVWLKFTLRGYGRVRTGPAHRMYYERAHGPIPPDHDVHHVCRNTRCVNPAHLEAVPSSAHRGKPRRLTRDQAEAIRDLALAGWQQADIAAAFGVSRQLVTNIKAGYRYAA